MTGGATGYKLIDSGGLKRLEQLGTYRVIRPCPSATWPTGLPQSEWVSQLSFAEHGTGRWTGPALHKVEERDGEELCTPWKISCSEITLGLWPSANGQVGVFPEQEANWRWIRERSKAHASPCRVLNLFAYTGGSSLAAGQGGAEVVHVDGAKSAVSRARTNAVLSGLADAPLRFLVDDVMSYVARAVRRGDRFDGIVLDPPAFGRGAKRKEWRIERDLPELVHLLPRLLTPEHQGGEAAFVLLSAHDPRWPAHRLEEALLEGVVAARGGHLESAEMRLTASSAAGRDLPMGSAVRWSQDG
mmetsp:Transcript_33887/g.72338  ORF Transcript_33887/g.72338 Transcript_33887/m.72338 type:complete len:301 (-) Transcript_33887:436-1338(-)